MIYITEMLINTNECSDDIQRLNLAIIGEKDAINLYIQLAQKTDNPLVAEILMDIAKEEKVHVGELMKCITLIDPEYASSLKDGAKEVEEKTKNHKDSESEESDEDSDESDEDSEDYEDFDDDDIEKYV